MAFFVVKADFLIFWGFKVGLDRSFTSYESFCLVDLGSLEGKSYTWVVSFCARFQGFCSC